MGISHKPYMRKGAYGAGTPVAGTTPGFNATVKAAKTIVMANALVFMSVSFSCSCNYLSVATHVWVIGFWLKFG